MVTLRHSSFDCSIRVCVCVCVCGGGGGGDMQIKMLFGRTSKYFLKLKFKNFHMHLASMFLIVLSAPSLKIAPNQFRAGSTPGIQCFLDTCILKEILTMITTRLALMLTRGMKLDNHLLPPFLGAFANEVN